jgi:hypothetical protein
VGTQGGRFVRFNQALPHDAENELVAPPGRKNRTLCDQRTSFAASRLRHSQIEIINNKHPTALPLPEQSGVATTG